MLSKLCVLRSLAKLGANQTSWRDHLHAFLQPRQSSNEILPEMTRGCFAWYLSVWSAAAKDALGRRIQKQPERQRQRSQRERPRDTAERKWETGRTLCFICSPQWHRAHSLCVVTHCRPDTHPPTHTHTTHTCLNCCTYKEPQWNGASLDTVSSSTILTLSEARGSLEHFFFPSLPPSARSQYDLHQIQKSLWKRDLHTFQSESDADIMPQRAEEVRITNLKGLYTHFWVLWRLLQAAWEAVCVWGSYTKTKQHNNKRKKGHENVLLRISAKGCCCYQGQTHAFILKY